MKTNKSPRVSFDVTTKDGAVHQVKAAAVSAADIAVQETGFVESIRSVAVGAWNAAKAGAALYTSLRAGGFSDVEAHKHLLKTAKAGGVNPKTATPYAKAARGLAAGVVPEAGEGYKEFADRCGTPIVQGGGGGTRELTAAGRARGLRSMHRDILAAFEKGSKFGAPKSLLDALARCSDAADACAKNEEEEALAEKNAKV